MSSLSAPVLRPARGGLVAFAVLSVTVLVLAAECLWLGARASEQLRRHWDAELAVTIFTTSTLTPAEAAELADTLRQHPAVASVGLRTREEVLAQVRDTLPALAEARDASGLPMRLDLTLRRSERVVEDAQRLAAQVRTLDGVAAVDAGEPWLETYGRWRTVLAWVHTAALWLAGLVLVVGGGVIFRATGRVAGPQAAWPRLGLSVALVALAVTTATVILFGAHGQLVAAAGMPLPALTPLDAVAVFGLLALLTPLTVVRGELPSPERSVTSLPAHAVELDDIMAAFPRSSRPVAMEPKGDVHG